VSARAVRRRRSARVQIASRARRRRRIACSAVGVLEKGKAMADIKKNDQNQNQPGQNAPVKQQSSQQQPARQQSPRAELVRRDPFHPMREWMRDPFGDMIFRNPVQLMREMMREPFAGMAMQEFSPQIEVRETTDAILIKADVPGIDKENLDISLHGNRLQICGKREDEHEDKQGDQVHAYERSYGSFTRVLTLPDTVDTEHITSELRDGVLTIGVPKRAGSQARKIQIGGGGKA
jgi:HSP20 family protein